MLITEFASLSLQTPRVEIPMREPDQKGPAGQAWLIPPTKPEHAASLGVWLVNIPNANQFWEWWVASVVHLREDAALAPPKLLYEGAEYEFNIFTVDTDESMPDPETAETEGLHFLFPPDVVEQFHGIGDAKASVMVANAVHSMIQGNMSPDSDYRPHWKQYIEKAVADFNSGIHVFN